MQEMEGTAPTGLAHVPVISVSTGVPFALVTLMSFPSAVPINKVVEDMLKGETLKAVAAEVNFVIGTVAVTGVVVIFFTR